jgi:hypothetical protein
MNLDIIVRGQSNAVLLMEWSNWAGAALLTDEVERMLGFDGIQDQVTITYSRDGQGGNTAYGSTAFLGDWMQQAPGGGWEPAFYEQEFLRYIAAQRNTEAASTAVLWVHSEFDSAKEGLAAQTWVDAVRTDAALVRQTLGRGAADVPYHFVSAFPFGGASDTGHQAVRLGMEQLADDPGFNGHIAARALDVDAALEERNFDFTTTDYGGPHLTQPDTALIARRAAASIAETWAAFARPGSPVALAGGDIADLGPKVVSAVLTAPDTLTVQVVHDRSGGFAALDAEAAGGIDWSAIDPGGSAAADQVTVLSADSLQIHFSGPVPAGGLLFYGHGYGRLAAPDQPGQGNAIYDQDGFPIWTAAGGVPVGGTPVAGAPPTGGGGGQAAPFISVIRDGLQSQEQAVAYSGPVAGLQYQFLGSATGDIAVATPANEFLNLLGGDDAADGAGGEDVLDGGLGSNFLTGGVGRDVFFLDGRSGGVTWSTITDWEQGEELSLWGWRPGVSRSQWVDGAGADGYRGITMHADLDGDGGIDASMTWANLTREQLPVPTEHDGLLWFHS